MRTGPRSARVHGLPRPSRVRGLAWRHGQGDQERSISPAHAGTVLAGSSGPHPSNGIRTHWSGDGRCLQSGSTCTNAGAGNSYSHRRYKALHPTGVITVSADRTCFLDQHTRCLLPDDHSRSGNDHRSYDTAVRPELGSLPTTVTHGARRWYVTGHMFTHPDPPHVLQVTVSVVVPATPSMLDARSSSTDPVPPQVPQSCFVTL